MRSFVTLFLDFFMPNKICNHRTIRGETGEAGGLFVTDDVSLLG
jgi:hypothetical protein